MQILARIVLPELSPTYNQHTNKESEAYMSWSKSQKIPPYVGVTGFTAPGQAKEVFSVLPRETLCFYMVGVLMSSKTLRGIENKYPRRYPVRDSVHGIFDDVGGLPMNAIHFSTDDQANLEVEMAALIGLYTDDSEERSVVASLNAIQLNVTWPSHRTLEWCHKTLFQPNGISIILQIGAAAIEQMDRNPQKIAQRVREYGELADYFLIDASGGKGKLLDVEFATECIRAIYGLDRMINVGVAGGLGPITIERIAPLLTEFPDLSIDAEGGLRDEQDNLSIDRAQEYLRRAERICKITATV